MSGRPHIIRDGKADRPGSGLYGRLTGDELRAAHEYAFRAHSLREAVRARMVELRGGEEGARWALAEHVAPVWGMTVKSADERLSRWFSDGPDGRPRRDMTTEPLEQLLGVLGLELRGEEQCQK